ncbi:MAG: cohesin domain-containing protein, partial [Candidatus Freyarchaeota archaeon]
MGGSMKEYPYYNLSLRRGKLLTVGLIFLMVLGVAAMEVNAPPAIPVLYVSPVISMAEPGESFTIDINVDDVSRLYSWSFYLKWDPAMLEVEKDGVVEGPFLSEEGVHKTYLVRKVYPDKGYMRVWCTLMGEPATAAASGSGTLATITFKVKASGEGILDLYETELLNFEGHPIKHIVEDGYLNVVLPTLLVEPSKVVDPTLKPGETFTIDVSILDAVNLSGFEFKLMYDTSLLEGENIAIAPFLKEPVTVLKEINKTLGFVWVKAESEAEPVSGSGALATITFGVKAVGECALDLYEAEVSDRLGRYRPPTVGGHFNNLPVAPKVHDIAVTEVTASPREVTVGETIS